MKPVYLQVAIASPLMQLFDYIAPDTCSTALLPGMRVKVPFRNKETIAILVGTSDKTDVPANKLKQALEVIDDTPIVDKDIFTLCQWASDYYHHSLGDVFANALPAALRQGKPLLDPAVPTPQTQLSTPSLTLNQEQAEAVAAILQSTTSFQTFLLDGITGSGKTEVYLKVIATLLQQDKQILVLVPEIALTPQMVERFTSRFDVPIATIHSNLTQKQRLSAWCLARNGEAKIVIGTRSAIFTPFANLGLIIIDEEHDSSFKQQDLFRYSARDLAMIRAHKANFPIVLGSATPALETLYNASKKRYQWLRLRERAGNARPPTFKLLNLQNVELQDCLSPMLINAIADHLERGEQVMLFLNRRGFAPILICHQCGWIVNCKRCDAPMTLHKAPYVLRCHHCTSSCRVPEYCDSCETSQLTLMGLGTERIEETLTKLFPDVGIARLDRDSTKRKGSMQQLLKEIHTGEKRILIGTQMLSKGHHFPNVTLVGVINADSGLFSADFRAPERTVQLIMQVSGRAGRAEKPGIVYIQTHHPEHPLLQFVVKNDYHAFAKANLAERKNAHLPPFAHIALFRAEALKQGMALDFLQHLKARFNTLADTTLFGPMPAPMEKRAGKFRAQLLVQSGKRSELHALLTDMISYIPEIALSKKVRWNCEIDPLDLT